MPKTPPKMRVSPDHPLLVLMAYPVGGHEEQAREMVRLYNELDDVVRPHVAVQIEAVYRDDFMRDRVSLAIAQEAGVPIVLQVQGDNGDRDDTVPFDLVREFVDRYPCIVGTQIVEASQRTFVEHPGGPAYTEGRNARYARDIIRLCGEYGLFMSWQLMRENYLAIGCSGDNELLYEAIVENRDYVIPMHEMNCEYAKLTDHIGAMGLWVAGATANWGVEAQSWYWHDCGYNAPGTCYPGTIEMPGGLYAIMFLLGASAGACAYSIEPPRDMWMGEGAWRWTDYMGPVFRRLITERLIPTKEEVLATMPVAYHLPICRRPAAFRKVLADLDFDHEEGRLIRAAYGVYDRARDAEMIPNNPRYGWIPALPPKTPESVLGRFRRVIRPGDLTSEDQAREILDEHFPPVDRGEAWSRPVGAVTIAANTHENWFVPESVSVTVPARPTGVRIDATDPPTLGWSHRAGDRTYRIWRLRDGREEVVRELPGDRRWTTLSDVRPGDLFAVSAVTDETETVSGTLHLHEFLLLSARESRRSAWVDVAGTDVERPRIGEGVAPASDAVLAAEARCAECTPVEDLASPDIAESDPDRATKYAVMEAMTGWKHALEAEDIEGFCAFYAPDYRETDGRTVESIATTLRSVIWKYLEGLFGKDADYWGRRPAWSNPVFRLLVRGWEPIAADRVGVDIAWEIWLGCGPELEPSDMLKIPWGRPNRARMVWRKMGDGWRIAACDPPIVRIEDTVLFRLSYQGW